MDLSYNALKPGYLEDLSKAEWTRQKQIIAEARHLAGIAERYAALAVQTGIPVAWLLVIDYRESGNNPKTYLGNGQAIIGTSRRTTEDPIGRGPFKTWMAGALDSLAYMKLSATKSNLSTAWPDISYCLWESERWNGFGYREYHKILSPYLWAGTTLYTEGKYDSDGRFNAKLEDEELGVVPLLQALGHISEQFKLEVA